VSHHGPSGRFDVSEMHFVAHLVLDGARDAEVA